MMTSIPGTAHKRFPQNMPLAERLTMRSRDEGECRVWVGAVLEDGYGRIWFNGKHHLAHRVAYKLAHGHIPEGLLVRHKCDNPPCIRLEHLEVGTVLDNIGDKVDRDRQARGRAIGKRKLAEESVAEIRRLLSAGALTQAEIGNKFGVTQSVVSQIKSGQLWACLGQAS